MKLASPVHFRIVSDFCWVDRSPNARLTELFAVISYRLDLIVVYRLSPAKTRGNGQLASPVSRLERPEHHLLTVLR
jgi:hypothetical protein